MLTTLIVSKPGTNGGWRRQAPGLTLSMAAHAAVVYAAAMATMPREPGGPPAAGDTTILYVSPQAGRPVSPLPPTDAATFRVPVPPAGIPRSIPPIDLTQPPFDPRDYPGIGPERRRPQVGTGSLDPTAVFLGSMTDEPPVRVSFPPPEYPRALQEARIEGIVVLEAVIDTLGHPEPASIKVLSSSNRAFEGAARDALRRALYRPGRVQGQRVRVLVYQPIKFQVPK